MPANLLKMREGSQVRTCKDQIQTLYEILACAKGLNVVDNVQGEQVR